MLGGLAAREVEDFVDHNMVIGLSWGTALDALVAALRPRSLQNPLQGVHVVQIIGALGTANPDIDGPELARRLARTMGGRYTILPAPLIVDSEATQRALIADGRVQATLAYTTDMNLALVGIGTLVAERSSLVRSGYLRLQDLAELEEAGAVGDVCAIHFDRSGHLVETALTRRVVGIGYQALMRIPHRLGIAGGQAKTLSILGALRAGMVNMLVTDDTAAIAILHEIGNGAGQ